MERERRVKEEWIQALKGRRERERYREIESLESPSSCASASDSPPHNSQRAASLHLPAIRADGRRHADRWNGVQPAEQRGSRARQAAQTPVAAAQDPHTHQAALPLGHRALPVPQPDPGEAPARPEEAPHVVALRGQTVTSLSPSQVSTLTAR